MVSHGSRVQRHGPIKPSVHDPATMNGIRNEIKTAVVSERERRTIHSFQVEKLHLRKDYFYGITTTVRGAADYQPGNTISRTITEVEQR